MRKMIVFLVASGLVFVSAGSLKAQLYLEIGSNTIFASHPTMASFMTSYSKTNETELEKTVGPFRLGNGYKINLGYGVGRFYTNVFGLSQTFHNQTAKFLTGNSRHFKYRYNCVDVGFGIRVANLGETGGIYLQGSIQFGTLVLRTYYEYADGSKEMGLLHSLNGEYACLVSMKPAYGIKVAIPFTEYIQIYASAEYISHYNIKFKEGDGSELTSQFMDLDDAKVMSDVVWELPADWEEFNDMGGKWSNYYGQGTGGWVKGDYGGIRLSFGLKIDIPDTKID